MRFSVQFSSVIAATAAFASLYFLAAVRVPAQIAPGVTQSAARTANITGTVTSSSGAPVANAEIRLSGTSVRSTKTNANGFFSFQSVPWGTYDVTVISSLGTASRGNIALSGDVNVAIQYQAPSQLRTIAHVSTSSAGAHINVTSSSIESITPGDYAFDGNGTWKGLFSQIPGVAVSGYALGGGAHEEVVAGSPQAPVALSLNGALPYETSTTLDGMPLQGVSAAIAYNQVGGGTDLSTLPLGAFETADIVRGPGANAPSIVDSIGGSFVLHGPDPAQKNQFEFAASNDPYGGTLINSKLALRLGRLSATFIYGVNTSPGPLGTVNSALGFGFRPSTINGQSVWSPVLGVPPSSITNCTCAYTAPLIFCCVYRSTAWNAHSGAADFSYAITPSISAEVFYAADAAQEPFNTAFYPVGFTPFATTPPYNGSYAPSPTGQYNYSLMLPYGNDLSNVASSLLEEKITAYIGSGVLRLAALQHNSFHSYVFAYPPSGEYTLWGTANVGSPYPGTPTAYNGTLNNLTFNFFEQTEYWSNNRDLLASYAVQLNSHTSAGISQTNSYYNMPWSAMVYSGGVLVANLVNPPSVDAATGETRVHVDFQPTDALSLGLSWYWTRSDYHVPLASNANEYGDKLFSYNAPRFGAVWRPTNNVAIRLAAGGGYALPFLNDLIGSPPTFTGSLYQETRANFDLQPETAFGYDVGTDVRLNSSTVGTLDLYQTNLYGQFFTSTSISTFNGLPDYINQYGNLATSRFQGINFTITHNPASGWYWKGTLGLTRAYVISVPPGFYNGTGCTNCQNQTVVPGANFNGSYLAAVPYASASALLGYKWKPNTYVDLSPTYYGNNNGYYQPAFIELDGHAGYAITPRITVLATFQNITGIYDQSVEYITPGYANPVIQGATGSWQGASFAMPYGPRSVIATVDYKL